MMKSLTTITLLMLFVSGCSAAQSGTKSLWSNGPEAKWTLYHMHSPDSVYTALKRSSSKATVEEAAFDFCKMDYEFLRSEGMLENRSWGVKVVSKTSQKESIFECSKIFNPTN